MGRRSVKPHPTGGGVTSTLLYLNLSSHMASSFLMMAGSLSSSLSFFTCTHTPSPHYEATPSPSPPPPPTLIQQCTSTYHKRKVVGQISDQSSVSSPRSIQSCLHDRKSCQNILQGITMATQGCRNVPMVLNTHNHTSVHTHVHTCTNTYTHNHTKYTQSHTHTYT